MFKCLNIQTFLGNVYQHLWKGCKYDMEHCQTYLPDTINPTSKPNHSTTTITIPASASRNIGPQSYRESKVHPSQYSL